MWLPITIALVGGFALGTAAGFLLGKRQEMKTRELAEELAQKLFSESESKRKAELDAVLGNMKESFGNLSLEALSRSTEEFLKLAKSRLEAEREVSGKELETKKKLIDQQLNRMTGEMNKVATLMKELEKDREKKFGELASTLEAASKQTAELTKTTGTLKEALANSRARGQWGERMAEDVLKMAGFIEKVNYLKQKAIEGIGSRPDFTFLLPRNLKLNMDVKFPLDNYVRYLEADPGVSQDKYKHDFLRDVRARIKEVTTRDYINPEQNTVDYVLLFIPNEYIYSFIHEQDSTILDEGIKNHVVFCSPITLFAVLAVIRQAVNNFALEQTSNEMLSLFGQFRKQWKEYLKQFDKVGKRIESLQSDYDTLMGTRRRQLDKPLDRIEELRTRRSIPVASEPEPGENVSLIEVEVNDDIVSAVNGDESAYDGSDDDSDSEHETTEENDHD